MQHVVVHCHEYGDTIYKVASENGTLIGKSESYIALITGIDFEPDKGESIDVYLLPHEEILHENALGVTIHFAPFSQGRSIEMCIPVAIFESMGDFMVMQGGEEDQVMKPLEDYLAMVFGENARLTCQPEKQGWIVRKDSQKVAIVTPNIVRR